MVDVYSEWCGPCKAMAPIFRKMKTDINDEMLHFAMVLDKKEKRINGRVKV